MRRLKIFNTFISTETYEDNDYLCIWITNQYITYNIVEKDITKYSDTNIIPCNCFIIYPDSIDHRRELIGITKRLDYFNKDGIKFISYNENAEFNTEHELIKKLQEKTIIKLFNKNNVMMTFNNDYHFRTLSGKHTDKFIKISNLLVDKNEIDFLSICLLEYINEKNIYLDTSTITSLIQSTIMLKKQLNSNYRIPTIQNFQSYEKLTEYLESMDKSNTKIIISTTTTATLVEKIKKQNRNFDDILVLFYYPVKQVSCGFKCLIELKETMNIPKAPKNYDSENCKFCKNGSTPVQLYSEQFILEIKEPEPIRLTIHHQPKYLCDFFKHYVGDNILTLGGRNNNSQRFDFTINNEKLIKNKFFNDKLNYILKRHFTYSIKQIIYIDNDSKSFAKLINKIIKKEGGEIIPYSFKEDFFGKNNHNKHDSILILAGSISSGYVLEEISRQLRDTHPNSSRFYMIGITKQYSDKSFSFMKGNLDKNHMFGQGHLVLDIDKILLPTKTIYTSWDKELEFLKKLIEKDTTIEKRINTLEAIKEKSSIKNIFWNNSSNKPLELADGFAFWPFYNKNNYKDKPISQVDVLYTFALVLQYSRVHKKDLEQTLYNPKVLAPENFARFNDGILQSSLLRLATSHELDYSTTHEFSKTITHMIKNIISKYNTKQGEAGMEFLIAIATKHLKLHSNDFKNLIEYLNKIDGLPDHFKVIIKYLSTPINKDNKYLEEEQITHQLF